jgi:hypothetical protein
MRKIIFISPFILIMLLSCPLFSQNYILKVKVQTANVRMEPDFNSTVIKTLPMGALLESGNKLGDWYEISVQNEAGEAQSGYIHYMVVDVVAGEDSRIQVEEPAEKVTSRPRETQPSQAPPAQVPVYSEYPRGGFKILGGLASANIASSESDLQGIDISDYQKSKLGFFGGIGYERGSQLSLETNILYMQKGVKYEGTVVGTFSISSNINVLSVPVLLKYRLMPENTPFILGGGEFSYIMSHDVSYDYENLQNDLYYSGTEDAMESTADFDYGIVLGAGFEMNKSAIPLYVEARYHLGLADIAETDEEYPQVEDTEYVKTRALVVMLGIRF